MPAIYHVVGYGFPLRIVLINTMCDDLSFLYEQCIVLTVLQRHYELRLRPLVSTFGNESQVVIDCDARFIRVVMHFRLRYAILRF